MSGNDSIGRILDPIISNIISPIVLLMFAVGLVVFAFGVFEMIWNGGDAEARSKGKMHMLGGVIGMFVMLSAWGLIYLVSNTLKTF
jgi:hypothetical protein